MFQCLALAGLFGHLRRPGQGRLLSYGGPRRRALVPVCQEAGIDRLAVSLAFEAFGQLLAPRWGIVDRFTLRFLSRPVFSVRTCNGGTGAK